MKIDLNEITVRDLVEDYHDDGEGGVRGYGGKLDIRPPFQREFVYKDKQRDAVIETINKGFPLNVMYWAVRQDGTYEVIDGQQRTISAAQYVEATTPLTGGISTTCKTTSRSGFSITRCRSMSARGAPARSWTGSGSSTSQAKS